LGVTTIISGVFPAEIGGTTDLTSLEASTIYTPADKLPAETLFVMKARSLSPLVWALVEGVELPQLSQTLAGSSDNKAINTLFKPGDSNFMRDNHLDARRGL
jgi:hypothetical protein